MVKQVVTKDMVPHLWANRSQDAARTSNGNLSFCGAVLYSYATPIAHLADGADGQPVALITSHSYSVTTSAHVSAAHGSARHLRNFTVPALALPRGVSHGRHREPRNLEDAHAVNLAHFAAGYAAALASAKRARSLPYWAEDAADAQAYAAAADGNPLARLARDAVRYAEVFGLPVPAVADWRADVAEVRAHHAERGTPAARAKREAERAARKVREARAAEVARLEGLARLEAWQRGEPVALHLADKADAEGCAYLRDAVRVFHFVRACREAGKPWHRNGHRFPVGGFEVDAVDAEGNFRAGCHRFNWREVERCARAAGVFEAEPDPSAVPQPSAAAA